jgi:hypothetical protein
MRGALESNAESRDSCGPAPARAAPASGGDPALGAGFLALTRALVRDPADTSELRTLLWAEHAVADALWKRGHGFVAADDLARATPEAVTQLGELARHPRWWARHYTLQVAASEPCLRAAVPLELLARDEHPLVRELADGLRAEKR